MKRKLEVRGDKKNLVIILDGKQRDSFGFETDVTAEQLYQALDFSLNAQYEFEAGDPGDLPLDVFRGFCSMLEGIVNGINELANEEGEAESGSADSPEDGEGEEAASVDDAKSEEG